MEFESFVNAIIEEPSNAAARFVFADFLEEQGDPRAQLVRLEAEQLSIPWWDVRSTELRNLRKYQIKLHHLRASFVTFPSGIRPQLSSFDSPLFFPSVEVTPSGFVRNAAKLSRQAAVTDLFIMGDSSDLKSLARSRHLKRIRNLRLAIDTSPEELVRLLQSEHLCNLEHLSLGTHNQACLDAIKDSAFVETLTSFHQVSYVARDSDSVLSLISSLPRLEALACPLSPTGLGELARSSECVQLRSLDAAGDFSDSSLVDFQQHGRCQDLKRFVVRSLRGYETEASSESAFDVVPAFPGLECMQLTKRGLTTVDLKKIVSIYPQLGALTLTDNLIDDEGVDELVRSGCIDRMVSLGFERNRLTIEGIRQLIPFFQPNRAFALNGNLISEEDLMPLRKGQKTEWHVGF